MADIAAIALFVSFRLNSLLLAGARLDMEGRVATEYHYHHPQFCTTNDLRNRNESFHVGTELLAVEKTFHILEKCTEMVSGRNESSNVESNGISVGNFYHSCC